MNSTPDAPELPPLPEPEWWAEEHGTGKRGRRGIYRKQQAQEALPQGDYFALFTTDQMHTYARAAIAAHQSNVAAQEDGGSGSPAGHSAPHPVAAAPSPVQATFEETAEPIWDQLTKIGESAPPGVWASVQAPADEVKRLADELPEPEWWAEEHGTGKRGRRGIYRKSQFEKQGQGDYFGLFTADQMRAAIHAAIDALCNPGEVPHD